MPSIFDRVAHAVTGNTPTDKAAAAVDRMTQRHEAAAAALAVAQADYAATLAKITAEDTVDLAKLADARAKLSGAETAERLAREALDATRVRHDSAVSDQQAADLDAAWSKAVAASKSREAVADRVQNLVRQLGEAFRELSRGTIETFQAVPNTYPTHARDAFAVEVGMCGALLATEYSRNGLPGGPNLLGIVPQTLADRLRQATVALEQARAKARNPEAADHG